jgi:DNA-binding transcriptional ArsR family regulator
MATSRPDLILHPVRLRLLAALARRQLTARQLSELLPDIPQATLYHHLGKLTSSGLLRVVSERQVRGAVEKKYALDEESAVLRPADLQDITREDHLRYFTIFVAMVLGDFARYLQQGAPEEPLNPYADGVSYSEGPLYLSDEEFTQAAAALRQALLPFISNEPAPNRRRRLLTTIVFPDANAPSEDEPNRNEASS